MHTATNTNANAAAGVTLRQIRLGAKLTLAQLSERVGVDESTLSRFENGKREISPALTGRVLQAIAAELATASGRAA